jgi:hypothetical protein
MYLLNFDVVNPLAFYITYYLANFYHARVIAIVF